jgi:exodeoxyribonuclease V gamma subunit
VLNVYRGNRAELLVDLLAAQLRISPPDPFTPVAVVVNTWPTSRWLGEQLALRLGGIAANLRFPFPGSHLRGIVEEILAEAAAPRDAGPLGGEAAEAGLEGPRLVDPGPVDPGAGGIDPWRAERLVWAVLPLLPQLAAEPGGEPLRRWLRERDPTRELRLDTWTLARSIADAFDDYGLYRPELLRAWEAGANEEPGAAPLPASQHWQPLLYRALRQRLGQEPFALRVERAIERLRSLPPDPAAAPLRIFGLSSLAPVQVRLLQALSGRQSVDLYLLTPCPDLWWRCADRRRRLSDALALADPLDTDWLLEAPSLEARFGRLGAEFQQLLEGTGEDQLGESRERDLFLLPANAALLNSPNAPVPLLLQLQQSLADSLDAGPLLRQALQAETEGAKTQEAKTQGAKTQGAKTQQAETQEAQTPSSRPPQLAEGDHSLEFHACPGPLRQVQIVRDRLLQLMAADPSLEPRDILVMTPQVDRLAPLVGAVFGDSEATGVVLPWRLTDRSQQAEGGIGRTLLSLLQLGGERLTATGLEGVLACGALQERFGLTAEDCGRLQGVLQRCGFRWGLDGPARGGDPTHSLGWAIDRLLLGLVLPTTPGLAPGLASPTAPAASGAPLELTGRWLHLLTRLRHWLQALGRPATPTAWAERLRSLLADLFADGGSAAAELPGLLAALDGWQELAGDSDLQLEAPVVAAVLRESLGADSGRFGHRSGALTISALEPMRAIPHRVIVLMGLDAGVFPRPSTRPGFHLMEQRRRLGDPQPADQDRYVLLEALLSARSHLLITWSNRDDRKGETLQPSGPVRQWLEWLAVAVQGPTATLLVEHAASPLERSNFLPQGERPPASCDRRLLAARRQLDTPGAEGLPPLLQRPMPLPNWPPPGVALGGSKAASNATAEPFDDLRHWLMEPQLQWLRSLGMRPAEWESSVEDLEALALGERERSGLLRGIEAELDSPPNSDAWLERCRGQGVLPPRSAGALEARHLETRRSQLDARITALGEPPWLGEVAWGPWRAPLRWQGDAVLVVQLAKGGPPQLLDLWLQLLLAAAAAPTTGRSPGRGVLIARDKGDQFATTTLRPPDPEAARLELERLADLREQWRGSCWPVPPRTGWRWWEQERRGESGLVAARQTWEGGPMQGGERQRAEMVACFGGDLPVAALLAAPFAELAEQLFEPVQAAVAPKPKASGRGSKR